MIRLNKLTDYAVVIMTEMGRMADVATAGAVSRRTTVPRPTVSKLLKLLAQHRLVVAHRGRLGGYGLARPAAQITVAEVIEAIEGPLTVSACVDGAADCCDIERTCPMHGRWDPVNGAIRRALQGLTLADMLRPEPALSVPPPPTGAAPAPRL